MNNEDYYSRNNEGILLQPLHEQDGREHHHATNNDIFASINSLPEITVLPVSTENTTLDKKYKNCKTWFGSIALKVCFLFSGCNCGPVLEIEQGHVGLLKHFGIYKKKLGPGLYTYNPLTEKIQIVDVRAKILDIPEQALLTRDNLTVTIDCYVNYMISVPEKA